MRGLSGRKPHEMRSRAVRSRPETDRIGRQSAKAAGREISRRPLKCASSEGSRSCARAITLDNVLGNYVVLDCGQSRFATYAHLKPGSIKVKTGDNIRAGQALGLLGNSGNSDAPHLHFQMTDGNAPLGSEGIPYAIQSFIQSAVLPKDSGFFDSGGAWRPSDADRSVARHDEFTVDGAVVTLP
jgi:hypothetical protein